MHNTNMKSNHPTRQLARQLLSETRAKRSQMAQDMAKELKTDNVSSVLMFPVKSTTNDSETIMIAYHNDMHRSSADKQLLAYQETCLTDNSVKYLRRYDNSYGYLYLPIVAVKTGVTSKIIGMIKGIIYG